MKKALKISSFTIFIILLGLFLLFHWIRERDYRREFAAMRGSPGRVELSEKLEEDGYAYSTVSSASSTGIPFSARIKVPLDPRRPLPALIILGGLRTGRRSVDYIGDSGDFIAMAIDYPYGGKKEDLAATEFLLALSGIHRAVLETPPAVMLGVDYLLSRDDVDPERIILIGGSLGAFFVPSAMAADPRISAAAMLFGAGDLQALIRGEIDAPFPLSHLGAYAASVLLGPVEPLKYIDDISPRPLLLLNGRSDRRIPVKLAEKLHERAKEPKEIVWIEAEHLDVKTEQFRRMVSARVMDWLERI